MNFEQITENYREIKSPVSDFTIHGERQSAFPDFVSLLKTEDEKSKKTLRNFYIIYIIVAVIYLLLFVVNPDPELTFQSRIAGSCDVIALLILIVLFRNKYSKIKKTDYLSSPKTFLTNARNRLSFWNKQQLMFIPVLILLDIGATLSISNYFGNLNTITGIILFQLVFMGLMLFGFYMGKREWNKKKKPIYVKIEKILTEFTD